MHDTVSGHSSTI